MDAYKPRRLKIMDAGLSNYTGLIGTTEFEDGVSLYEVPWQEAQRLGANVRIEDANLPGHQVNEVAELIRTRSVDADDQRVLDFNQAYQVDGELRLGIDHLTREQLESIADQSGLAGVRELARKWGGTGRSINECINVVLQGQAETLKARLAVPPAPEPLAPELDVSKTASNQTPRA